MIVGLGTDLIEVYRIACNLDSKAFLDRVYTENEQMHAFNFKSRNRTAEILAGNFAVKESFSKALGTGIVGFKLTDIEVLRDKLGKPYINLINEEILTWKKITNIHVSISNTKEYVTAVCILEGEI